MVEIDVRTKTYEVNDSYRVDVVITDDFFSAWIYEADSCVKSYMFGCPRKQQSYWEFLGMVEANLDEHIKMYQDEYEICEE